jgi:transposase
VLDLSARQQNDFKDAEVIAETVERPTIKFIATTTADHDLQAPHGVREPMPTPTRINH